MSTVQTLEECPQCKGAETLLVDTNIRSWEEVAICVDCGYEKLTRIRRRKADQSAMTRKDGRPVYYTHVNPGYGTSKIAFCDIRGMAAYAFRRPRSRVKAERDPRSLKNNINLYVACSDINGSLASPNTKIKEKSFSVTILFIFVKTFLRKGCYYFSKKSKRKYNNELRCNCDWKWPGWICDCNSGFPVRFKSCRG